MSAASSVLPEATAPRAGIPRHRRVLRVAAPLLGLVLILWLLDRLGWSSLAASASRLGWAGAALVLGVGFLEPWFDSLALRAAAHDRLGIGRALLINQAGALLNMALPAEAGEVWKAALMRRGAGEPGVAATVVWNYAFKLTKPLVAIALAALAWILGDPDRRALALPVLFAALLSLLPYLVLRLLLRQGLATLAIRLLSCVPWVRRRVRGDLVEWARRIDLLVRRFAHERPAAYARVLAYQAAARAASFGCAFALLAMIAPGTPLPLVALVFAAQNVLSYLLLALPTRVGVTEGGTLLLFELLRLDGGTGLVFAVLTSLKNLAYATLGVAALPRAR